MQDTAQPTAPRALARTWAVQIVYRECGVVTGTAAHTVTLTRTAEGIAASLDGQPVELARAVRVLGMADTVTVTAQVLDTLPAPTIGKARAAILHRFMGRLGLPSAQHYALAAAALGEWAPLPSLADLSEGEAGTVWAHLCHLYPQARRFTAA